MGTSTIGAARTARTAGRRAVFVLACVAYLPLVLSERGRLPADTKLGLTLDPMRLMSDAMRSWDTGQFAGWVPHQSISYLWPSGPFHAALIGLGIPEWLTQRLWAGTVVFAAGAGVWWFVRRRGYSPAAAFVAALVYQTTPYILSYISRTSLMLMPWAALGWLLALTDQALDVRRDWKRPTALFGLVVGTALGINLTSAVMIAPAPLIVIVLAVRDRHIDVRRALVVTIRLGAVAVVASAWWMAMLLMQGRYGAKVLGYSETLEAVSSTSSAPEVLRGLGYWLNYIHAPSGVTTSAATDYMTEPTLIAIGMVLLVVTVGTLAVVRFRERGLAGALLLVGLVLAVGPHPIDDAAPLMSGLADSTRSTLALSFRSSTRAIPLVVLATALCAAALVDRVARHRSAWRVVVAPVMVALTLANLPALFTGALVDPELLHDQRPPAEWYDAVAVLDQASSETRVLQLPGVESQVFAWGYTVDPPLAMLTDRPLITRDWLPLGTPAAMDLLYAFDDRFQNGTIDPAAVAPISRLLGVGTVWLALDANPDRFASARPDAVADVLDRAPGVRRTDFDGAHVRLYDIDRPVEIARAATRTVVVFGSGDGVVDAAAAGLIDGTESLLYAADLTDDELQALADRGAEFIVTDSNRDRARQWRGSQDVWGFTETGGPDDDLLVADPQDNRLPVFVSEHSTSLAESIADQTIATLSDGLVVEASHYGSRLALMPEYRPAMAVDGDPSTAWAVGFDLTPIVGESIRLSSAPEGLLLRQLAGGHDIRSIAVDAGGTPTVVELDARSHTDAGQPIALAGDGPVTITILEVTDNEAALADHVMSVGAGFAELLPTAHTEVVRTPSLRTALTAPSPVTVVLTRLRTEKPDRLDVEPVLRRSFSTPAYSDATWRVQVRARGSVTVETGCRDDLLMVDGAPLALQIDTAASAQLVQGESAWLTPCEKSPLSSIAGGEHLLESGNTLDTGLSVDVVTLAPSPVVDAGHATPTPSVTIDRDVDDHTLHIEHCDTGCWLVFGEGYSDGWSATSDDAALGAHRSVSGGFNGWWIEPNDANGRATVRLHWAAQRPIMWALALSTLGAIVFLAMALWPVRRRTADVQAAPTLAPVERSHRGEASRLRSTVSALVTVVVVAITVSPRWGLYVVPIGALGVALHRRRIVSMAGVALVGLTALRFVIDAQQGRIRADFGWPGHFAALHRPMMVGTLLVAVTALDIGHRSRRRSSMRPTATTSNQ